jgi:hypothetical protein
MTTKLTRRGLVRLAAVSGGLSVLGATSGIPRGAVAQPAAGSPAPGGIEPITIKRRGIGYRGCDQTRAFPGFTLFAPSGNTNKTIYLIDL